MESFLDTTVMQEGFKRELQKLPLDIRKPLDEWHQRLKQKGKDVCILSSDAEKAYGRYNDPLIEISNEFLEAAEKTLLKELYKHIASDALLVSALFASQNNTTLKPTIIELNQWALAQHFMEDQRKRYHTLSLSEAQKIFDLKSDVTNKYQGRVRVKNHATEDYPFFLWITLAVQTDDPQWHGIRLLAQRAYYP